MTIQIEKMEIFDAHTHIGSFGWEGYRGDFSSADEAINELRTCGVIRACTVPWRAVLCETEADLDAGNAEALSLRERFPEFIYPGVVIDFRWPARSLFWLKTFQQEGLRLVGELVPKSAEGENPFTHPAWRELFDAVEEAGMCLQLHNTTGTAKVAKAHPRLQIIGSHLPPSVLPELVALPNVVLDISGYQGGLCLHSLDKAREAFGAERLLFGTDYDGYDPRPFIMRVQRAFTEAEQRLVFRGNFKTIIEMDLAWHTPAS